MNTIENEIAENLLFPIWESIDTDYKKKYSKNIWEQFENQILFCLFTKDIQNFVTKIKKSLPCQLNLENSEKIYFFSQSVDNEEVMKLIRQKSNYLIFLVRKLRDEKQQDNKK